MKKKRNIILQFILEHKVSYIIGIAFMFLASYVTTRFPKVLGNTIDIMKEEGFSSQEVLKNVLIIIAIALGTFCCTYAWRNLVIRNARKLECYLRELLFTHFQKMSPEFYNKRKSGDLIVYAINDLNAVRMMFGPATAMTINGIAICTASIYAMTQNIDFRLAIICLAPIPVIVIILLKLGSTIRRRFKKVQETFGSISDRVQENINGIRVIKAYVQEEEEVEKFEELNEEMKKCNMDMVRISSMLTPIMEICFSVSFVFNLIVGGNLVLKGSITLGDFTAFNTYLTMIMAPIISIGRIVNVVQRGMASYKRLDEIFKVEPHITNGAAMIDKKISGDVKIQNLSFTYEGADEPALKSINIEIPKGHTLGVIGKTGSGKTTLASLLMKLYNVENNKIIIDGIDINDYTLNALRSGISYVPQDNFLFSASIFENIRFFKEEYSMEMVEEASKASCIYDSISSFPEGFNTVLGERGVNLSGGQKQRTSIARAIVKNPAILILDDALSAVDTITEGNILNNFKEIRKNKSAIIIAHKISSVKHADEIIVLDHGEICERGTHEELISKRGVYYEIYTEQNQDNQSEFKAS